MKTNKQTIGIIGGGNMGAAIIAGIMNKYAVSVCEQDQKRCQYLKRKFKLTAVDLKTAVSKSQIIVLAVKPQDFEAVLKEVSTCITKETLVISIAAGITTAYIEKRLGDKIRVIRTMPNLAVQLGQGMTGVCEGKAATNTDLVLACRIFNNIGKVVVVEEKYMDAVTAVSGSGPAYVFLFVENLMEAAKSLGLNEDISRDLVMQTLKGSLSLLEKKKEDPGVLREKVTSKGGTTEAAMDVFMKNKSGQIFKDALAAAKKRAHELSK